MAPSAEFPQLIPPSATAARSIAFWLSAWPWDAADAEKVISWSRKQWEAVRPYLEEGVYVNYLGEDEGAARVRSAYGINYDRLASIKAKYDPGNLFRLNQNINPAP